MNECKLSSLSHDGLKILIKKNNKKNYYGFSFCFYIKIKNYILSFINIEKC